MLRRRPQSQAFFQTLEDTDAYQLRQQLPKIVYVSDDEDEVAPIKQEKVKEQKFSLNRLSKYQRSLQNLELKLQKLYGKVEKQDLFFFGFGVYRQVVSLMANKKHKLAEQTLIDVLDGTRLIVGGKKFHPTGNTGYKNELHNYQKLAKKVGSSSLGKTLLNLMLALVGAVIIAASGVMAFASFGILTPVNAVGFLFGYSLLTGMAASITTGAIGLGTVMSSSIMFYKSLQKGTLSKEMYLAANAARKTFV
jgi:hypothetical protein